MVKWTEQGIGGMPFLSRTAAKKVEDTSKRTLLLLEAAVAKHGPIEGYTRSIRVLVSTLKTAREFLNRR